MKEIRRGFLARKGSNKLNGFNLADASLKNGGTIGIDYLGLYHYVSTAHAATNNVMAGIRKVQKLGLLKRTFGRTYVNEMPANNGVTATGSLSGTQIHTRLDYGLLVPTNLLPTIFDVNTT